MDFSSFPRHNRQMTSPLERPWPIEIRLHRDRRRLTLTWDDGLSRAYSAEYLRVNSPSAEVQGHGPGQKQLVTGKDKVEIQAVEPVGAYAIRLIFDDMHSTGIYDWDWFRHQPE